MIAMQLADYLGRGGSPRAKFGEPLQELKMAVQLREASRHLSPSSTSTTDSSLEGIAKQVEADASKDLNAARIYAATKGELKQEVPPAVLDRLRNSDDPRDKILLEVFSSK